jgi:hypothetical protein
MASTLTVTTPLSISTNEDVMNYVLGKLGGATMACKKRALTEAEAACAGQSGQARGNCMDANHTWRLHSYCRSEEFVKKWATEAIAARCASSKNVSLCTSGQFQTFWAEWDRRATKPSATTARTSTTSTRPHPASEFVPQEEAVAQQVQAQVPADVTQPTQVILPTPTEVSAQQPGPTAPAWDSRVSPLLIWGALGAGALLYVFWPKRR